VIKGLCTGTIQSIFAMMYNFPARMAIAHKSEKQQQLFSQRDLECGFEAFLGVCMQYAEEKELVGWFGALLEPWLPLYMQAAAQLQMDRDAARSLNENKHYKPKWADRRVGGDGRQTALRYVKWPTLRVSSVASTISKFADLFLFTGDTQRRASSARAAHR
jgi:hypothetical protein